MYHSKGDYWTGSSNELAKEVMIQSAGKRELKTQISQAFAILKEEGILTAKSGFIDEKKDRILLELDV